MSEDLSNKTLAALLVLSIVVTLTGTVIFLSKVGGGLTGFQVSNSPTAQALLNVSAVARLNWTSDAVNWGTGSVPGSAVSCEMNTQNGTVDPANCTGFTNVTRPLTIENTGNRKLELNVSVDVNATEFANGTNPKFDWLWRENETGSCVNVSAGTGSTGLKYNASFAPVNKTNGIVCPVFLFADANDALNLHLRVVIPNDAPAGNRTAIFTAIGSSVFP